MVRIRRDEDLERKTEREEGISCKITREKKEQGREMGNEMLM